MSIIHGLIAVRKHQSDFFDVGRNTYAIADDFIGIVMGKEGSCARIVWGGGESKVHLDPGETLGILRRDFGATVPQTAPCADYPDVTVTWHVNLRLLRPENGEAVHPFLQGFAVAPGEEPPASGQTLRSRVSNLFQNSPPQEVLLASWSTALSSRVARLFQDRVADYFRPLDYVAQGWSEETLGARIQDTLASQPGLSLAVQLAPAKGFVLDSVVSPIADARRRDQKESRQYLERLAQEAALKEEIRRLAGAKLESEAERAMLEKMIELRNRNRLEFQRAVDAAKLLTQEARAEFLRQQIDAMKQQGEMRRTAEEANAKKVEIDLQRARLQLQLQEKALERMELQKQAIEQQRLHEGRVEAEFTQVRARMREDQERVEVEFAQLQAALKQVLEREDQAARTLASAAESISELNHWIRRLVERAHQDAIGLQVELAEEKARRQALQDEIDALRASELRSRETIDRFAGAIDGFTAQLQQQTEAANADKLRLRRDLEMTRNEYQELLKQFQTEEGAGTEAKARLAEYATKAQRLQDQLQKWESESQATRRDLENQLAKAQAEKRVLEDQQRERQENERRLEGMLHQYLATVSRLNTQLEQHAADKEALDRQLAAANARRRELEALQRERQQAEDEAAVRARGYAASILELSLELRRVGEANLEEKERLEMELSRLRTAKTNLETEQARLQENNRAVVARLAEQIASGQRLNEKIREHASALGAEKARLTRELAESKARLESLEELRRHARDWEKDAAAKLRDYETGVEELKGRLRREQAAAEADRARFATELDALKQAAQARAKAHADELGAEKQRRAEAERRADAGIAQILTKIAAIYDALQRTDEASALEQNPLLESLILATVRKEAAEREQARRRTESADAIHRLEALDERITAKEREAAEFIWARYEMREVQGGHDPRPLPMDWVLPGGSCLQLAVHARRAGWFYLLALCREIGVALDGKSKIEYQWETLYANDLFNTLDYTFHRPKANRLEAGEQVVLPKDGRGEGLMQQFWQLDNVAGGYEYLYALFCPRKLTNAELDLMQLPVPSREFTTRGFTKGTKGFVKPGAPPSGGAEDPGWNHLQQFSQQVIEHMEKTIPPESTVREYIIFHS